jgi:phosphoenolpyruvate carboxylase
MAPAQRKQIRRAYQTDALFRSYVNALGFTLAKVEMPVWRVYLMNAGLSSEKATGAAKEFETEYLRAIEFVRAISGSKNLVWFRPWLGTSIRLRSPMIHPLNLLQIIAFEREDGALIRATVTGIASGMMTTG